VKGGLYQPRASGTACDRTIHHRLHQFSPDAEVLRAGMHGDRSDASDRGTLVEAVAPHNSASVIRYHAVEVGTRNITESTPTAASGAGKSQGNPCFAFSLEKAS
jgi:hypothetical protein